MTDPHWPSVFRPIQVGTMALDHRLAVPPHGGGAGSLVGTDEQFEQYCAFWLAKVEGGTQWIGGAPSFVRNPLPPGFEPTGIGANGPGFFRLANFVPRLGEMARRVHALGGFLSTQMVLQGGMPLGASAIVSGYNDHRVPHVMDTDEVVWLVREYGESAALAAEAGVDAIELHANHDDVLQWFLSPLTNHRDDVYGGSFEGRRRLLREVVESIRAHIDRPITLGLRLCLDEMIDGGYGLDECQAMIAAFTAEGMVDYFSLDVGNNWGVPSYIPVHSFEEGAWAPLCGQAKEATSLPVVYAGRVSEPATAERIVASGQADVVALARANMADPSFVNKVRSGDPIGYRPCIGLNECIHRRTVEGLPFGCGVNPLAGRELEGVLPPATTTRSILVIGGGPAGSELAALCAERGHQVELWERNGRLGGQLAIAALARSNTRYATWITWQTDRLAAVGVKVVLDREATKADVLAAGADVVAVATGASPRGIDVPGHDLPHVVQAGDVLTGAVRPGQRVLVVSEDDRAAPLAIADQLVADGHDVTLVYQTPAPSPLLGKYSIGATLASLDAGGAELVAMARVVAITADDVQVAHTYSGRRWSLGGFDSIVLACGAQSADGLFRSVKHAHPAAHLLGDAFAPRRMVFATRQAWELARLLD